MAKTPAKPTKPAAAPKKADKKPAKKAPKPKIFDPLGPGHKVSHKSGG
jgi:hypothetical protein